MRRPNREVSIFSLSALDVLATSTGVFVLFVVILLPYYQLTEDAGAAIARQQADIGNKQQQAARLRQSAEDTHKAAAALRGDSSDLAAEAEALRGRSEALRHETTRILGKLSSGPVNKARPRGNTKLQFIEKLDLVFVIDTTRSMRVTLQQLSESLGDIVAILKRLVRSLQVGVIAYRDAELGGPVLTVLKLTPTSSFGRIQSFMSRLRVASHGGKTIEEDVLLALQEADGFAWRNGSVRQIILIGDAAAHPGDQAASIALARRFHQRPDSALSTLFIATDAFLKYGSNDRKFFARLARAGGGNFSEHSGRIVEGILLSILKKNKKQSASNGTDHSALQMGNKKRG